MPSMLSGAVLGGVIVSRVTPGADEDGRVASQTMLTIIAPASTAPACVTPRRQRGVRVRHATPPARRPPDRGHHDSCSCLLASFCDPLQLIEEVARRLPAIVRILRKTFP